MRQHNNGVESHCHRSDSYLEAFYKAEEKIQEIPLTLEALEGLGRFAEELACRMTDSSESLSDDRNFCRAATIDVTRIYLRQEIAITKGKIDALLKRAEKASHLERAKDAVDCAERGIDTQPFANTLTHLKRAREELTHYIEKSSTIQEEDDDVRQEAEIILRESSVAFGLLCHAVAGEIECAYSVTW